MARSAYVCLLTKASGWHTAVMCGRYLMTSPVEAIRQMFRFKEQLNIAPNYNVAPTHEMPVVRMAAGGEGHELVKARWGLIPHWAKDTKMAYSTINARSETAASKLAFRDAFKHRHALIPADAFYEWRRVGDKDKQPYLIRLKGGGLFAFAGLWSTWRSPEGEDITSYTIMTTEPNALLAKIHNRMPVILARDDHERWLANERDSADLLRSYPADDMEAYPVGKRVGNVRNNDAALIEPLS